jgi:hypothetical protein
MIGSAGRVSTLNNDLLVASIADTIIGGVIAAIAGLLAVVAAGVLAERRRKAAERSSRIENAASAIGRTLSLLRGSRPEGILVLGREKAHEIVVEDLWPRWDPLQDDLEVLAAAHPDDAIRAYADALIEAMRKLFSNLRYFSDYRAEEPLSEEQWGVLNASHADAVAKANELIAAVRA